MALTAQDAAVPHPKYCRLVRETATLAHTLLDTLSKSSRIQLEPNKQIVCHAPDHEQYAKCVTSSNTATLLAHLVEALNVGRQDAGSHNVAVACMRGKKVIT